MLRGLFRKQQTSIDPPDEGFVDIHAHVIPSVDDGPDSWEESMAILRNAAACGTRVLVATPHGDTRARWKSLDQLRDGCRALNHSLSQEGVPLTVVLGMENPLGLDAAQRLEEGRALTVNRSPYVLLEFPYVELPLYWEEVLFKVQLLGKIPIIVHPERHVGFQEKPHLLENSVNRGALVQVTAASLTARFGSRVRKTAHALMKAGLVHIIASDTHAPEGVRGPDLLEGYAVAADLVGLEAATRMMSHTPRAVIQGQPAPVGG